MASARDPGPDHCLHAHGEPRGNEEGAGHMCGERVSAGGERQADASKGKQMPGGKGHGALRAAPKDLIHPQGTLAARTSRPAAAAAALTAGARMRLDRIHREEPPANGALRGVLSGTGTRSATNEQHGPRTCA